MAPEELQSWLGQIIGPFEIQEYGGYPIATATTIPICVSFGFSEVDTGVIMERPAYKDPGSPDTDVRCELVCAAEGPSPERRAMAVAGAWNSLAALGAPAQPGVLLADLVDDPELNVHHGLLRDPQIFERGTPHFKEPGRMTLLLELVLLTDDEFEIVTEQGFEVFERRVRRRQAELGDWNRE